MTMQQPVIPEVVIERLPVYARALSHLAALGNEVVSSQELGAHLGVTPAQIRKDFSYFGRFGKQGRGYNIKRLIEELRQILGLNREWPMVLVGIGRLGRAILSYGGFAPEGFRVVQAFDADPKIVGRKMNGLTVKDVASLETELARECIGIGIVAVPARMAQEVIDRLVECGVRSILSYAPAAVRIPEGVHIRYIDPVLALQSMTFYLKENGESPS
jgi:redox-sensing transcriptional repressor